MKFRYILLFVLIVCLCGCNRNNTMTCKVDTETYKSTALVTLKGEEVNDITVTNTYSTDETAKNACRILSMTTKNIECKDKKIVLTKYQETLDLESLTKENVKKYFENHKYKCE